MTELKEFGKGVTFLTLEDKLLVLNCIDKEKLRNKIAFMFKLHPRAIFRISKNLKWLIEQDKKGKPREIKRPLYDRFPAIGNVVIEFIKFARSQRLPVTLRLIQERARKEAETHGVLNVHTS